MSSRSSIAARARAALATAALAGFAGLAAPAAAQDEGLGRPGSTISGHVEVENVGPPSERLEVMLAKSTGGGSRRVFTDSTGTFFFGGIFPGTSTLSVRPPLRTGYGEGSTEVSIDATRPTNYAVSIIIRRKVNDAPVVTGGRVYSALETDAAVPKQARQLYKKATEAARQQRTAEAVSYFEQALAIAPDYLFALNDLGVQYTRLGRYSESVAVLRRAVAAAPTSFPPHVNLAMALLGTGDVQAAAAEVKTAIGIDPSAFDALYLSGVVEKRLGNAEAAIDAFQKAYEQGGADAVFAQFELGQLYEAAGQAAAAARAYKLFLQFVTSGPQAEYARQRLRTLAHA
jgi:tetratricopeptide (TPR) repeat protein